MILLNWKLPLEKSDQFGIVEKCVEISSILLANEFVERLYIVEVSFPYEEVVDYSR